MFLAIRLGTERVYTQVTVEPCGTMPSLNVLDQIGSDLGSVSADFAGPALLIPFLNQVKHQSLGISHICNIGRRRLKFVWAAKSLLRPVSPLET